MMTGMRTHLARFTFVEAITTNPGGGEFSMTRPGENWVTVDTNRACDEEDRPPRRRSRLGTTVLPL